MTSRRSRNFEQQTRGRVRVIAALAAIGTEFIIGQAFAGSDSAQPVFSQSVVLVGSPGKASCTSEPQRNSVGCDSEHAPDPAKQTIVITAGGHAFGSVVVTYDGYGSGEPVLAVNAGTCPVTFNVDDGRNQQIGATAEFVIAPADRSPQRVIRSVLKEPQPARTLGHDRSRIVFTFPALEQPLAPSNPIDLGEVQPGDRISLRLLATGIATSCDNGAVQRHVLQADLWGQSSTELLGYLSTPETTDAWDDTKIAPFKVSATVTY